MAVGLIGVAVAYKGLRFAISSVKEFAAFEMGLANVSTMLDDSTMKYMPAYEKQLKKMAREFGQSTGTLSKGLYDILSASISADKAIKVLRVSSKAAIAGLTDTGTAADALTTILNSYGLEAEQVSKVSDILFATVKAGKITFGELAGSIGKVSSLAAAVGLDFTEVSAAISTMTRAGVQSDIAMTALKAMLTAFLKPQGDAIIVAEKYGLVLNANTLKTIGLTGVMAKLTEATNEDVAAIFPNVRALTGVAALRGNLTGLIEDQEQALNSLGMQEKAYHKIADTTGTKLKMLAEDWKALKVATGEYLALTYVSIIEAASALDELSEAQERWGRIGTQRGEVQIDIGDWETKSKAQVAELIKILEDAGQHVPGPMRQMLEPMIELVQQRKELFDINTKLRGLSSLIDLQQELKNQIVIEKELAGIKKEQAGEIEKYTADQAEAYRRLYNELGFMTDENYNYRIGLLDAEKEKYAIFIKEKSLLDAWYAEQKKELDRERALESQDFVAGFGVGIDQMQEDLKTFGEFGAETAKTMKEGMSDYFMTIGQEGSDWANAMEGIFLSVARSYQRMVADMIAQQMMESIMKPLIGMGISALAGGIGGMFSGGGVAAGQVLPDATIMGMPNAKGNIFNNGSVVPFDKGGILDGPTIFPMSNGGLALGGEAGQEAIMPLGRDNQGRLGVRTDGSGESKQSIKIINVMDFSQVQEYLNSGEGERQIINLMQRNANEIQEVAG